MAQPDTAALVQEAKRAYIAGNEALSRELERKARDAGRKEAKALLEAGRFDAARAKALAKALKGINEHGPARKLLEKVCRELPNDIAAAQQLALCTYKDEDLPPDTRFKDALAILCSGERKIAFISSRMGSIASNLSGGAYGYRASKAALNAIARSLAIDLYQRGIVVTVFHPGRVAVTGGPAGAPIAAEDSIAGMRRIIHDLGNHETGQFYTYTGMPLPW